MKKKIITYIFLVFFSCFTTSVLAQMKGPSNPGGAPVGSDPPLGGGAPVGSGIGILLFSGAVYTLRKIYKVNSNYEK